MLGRKGLLFGTALLLLAIGGDLASAADSKKPDSVEKNKETAEEIVIPEAYTTWLEELKQDMINKGIKPDTVETVFEPNYYHPKPEVVKIDRRQIEFVLTSTDYLNKVINNLKVKQGQKKYKELYPLFHDMEKNYGVPFEYIVAFWGMETNYGRNFGHFNIIEALVQMSYDKRRPAFFRAELYEALKMIDNWGIDYTKMEGSSFEDAAASSANYLSKLGWKYDITWGMEVSLPWDFDYALTGRKHLKTVSEWKKIGVKTAQNQVLPLDDNLKVSIIVPEGKKGKAYLITENFRKILVWNRSENYALGVGILADFIKSGKTWTAFEQHPSVRIKTDDIVRIQDFINKLGWFSLSTDGQLGPQTREAIKEVQKKAKLAPDGYPDYQLLQKINSYNPDIGFAIPVPLPKAQKNSVKN